MPGRIRPRLPRQAQISCDISDRRIKLRYRDADCVGNIAHENRLDVQTFQIQSRHALARQNLICNHARNGPIPLLLAAAHSPKNLLTRIVLPRGQSKYSR